MRLLFVDADNTCASALAEVFAGRLAMYLRVPIVTALSAGTTPGGHACPKVQEIQQHRPRQLTIPMVNSASLILTTTRAAQAPVSSVVPECRNRMLTIRQAGRWAAWMQAEGFIQAAVERAAGVRLAGGTYDRPPSHMAEAMPATWPQRVAWITQELDACRGLGPDGLEPGARSRRRRDLHPDDLPDPHHHHQASHARMAEILQASLLPLMQFAGSVASLPSRG